MANILGCWLKFEATAGQKLRGRETGAAAHLLSAAVGPLGPVTNSPSHRAKSVRANFWKAGIRQRRGRLFREEICAD